MPQSARLGDINAAFIHDCGWVDQDQADIDLDQDYIDLDQVYIDLNQVYIDLDLCSPGSGLYMLYRPGFIYRPGSGFIYIYTWPLFHKTSKTSLHEPWTLFCLEFHFLFQLGTLRQKMLSGDIA